MKRLNCVVFLCLLFGAAPRLWAAGNLFINEVLFEPPPSNESQFEYVELRGAAGEAIPDKTYFLAIDSGTNNPGKIRNYFELGGKQIGTNGFLVLLPKNHSYATITGATVLSNTASLAGWGDATNSTVGHCGDNGRTNIINSAVTFLLVRCTNAPDPHLDIDTNNNGVLDGEALSWTILDGVGVLGSEPAGSFGYGKINFIESGGATSAPNVVLLGFNASYVARNGHTTGWASNDWVVADVVTNGTVKWKLHTGNNVHPLSRAGALLNHIGGSNFGASNNQTPLLVHSEGLSGVVNHPGNPVLPLTISDAETTLSTLQVTATSLDPSALPTNRVTVVYTNSQWLVRFTPTNVCYNVPVRVRVSDGTNYSENIMPYAASGLWTTNVGFHIGLCDASTAIPIDTNLMLVADDETFPLRLYSRTNCGLAIKEFNFVTSLGLTNLDGEELGEMDLEGASRFGDRIYWLGSLGNITDGPLAPNRNRIYATAISGTGTNVQLAYVGRYDKLRNDVLKWDAEGTHGKGAGYYGLETSAAVLHPPKTNDGFVAEGFCFIANGGSNQAYIGLRAPLVPRGERRRALLIPILNLASLVASNPAAGPAQLGAPVELDLGGRGIRSIEYLNGTYWMIAGPPGSSTEDRYEFRLFSWSGNVLESAQMWSANFQGIIPEGMVDFRITGTNTELQVIGDHGFSKLYEPATSSSTKKLFPLAFRQFRLEWVSIGSPTPLQVLEANFAVTGARQFIRGSGSTNQFLSIVEALDNITGVRLDDGGGNANSFYPGHNWTNQLRHWNATNTGQSLLFTNPLAAFGSLAGMPTLYVGRTYHFHVGAGAAIGTNRQSLRITAYDRATKQQMGWQEMVLARPADTNYHAFFERGLVLALPQYGLDSLIRPQFTGGAPSQEFTLEHRAFKTEYFFVVSLIGQVLSNSVAVPLVWSGANALPSPLYVLNFDFEPAWQSHFLAQPHLHGEPAPSSFLGDSVEELRSTNALNSMSLVVTQLLSTLKNVDLSPELRVHPRLDRLVADYDYDPVALANYVFNEVLLTDAFSPGAASSVLRSGGVRRGAYAAYMEGQASPTEQCALLVYLLRRCDIPCGYIFPSAGTLKLHQNMLQRLFPFTIQVSGGSNGNALVETDFPCVAAYVDGGWRVLTPWLKDLEVQEGLDLTDYMPARYRTGRDWVMGYLRFDVELMKLAFKSDTPTTLLPRYLKQMLQDNYTGLSLEDFGVRVRTRKHHYSRWSDFPLPAVVTGTNTVVESLATLMQSQSAYSNLFERVEVEVTSTTNSARTLATGKFRTLDLHNRVLQLSFVETNGSHWMNLGLQPFRNDLTQALSFSNALAAGLTSTQTLHELRESLLLDATDDELVLRLRWHSFQPPATNIGNATLPVVSLVQTDRATNAILIERKLRKGDLTTLSFDAGRVSGRMGEGVLEDLKRARAATNSSGDYLRPEHVDGLTAFTISTTYFNRTDAFRGALGRLYKTHVDAARAVAVSSLLAKRQTNGLLLAGAIQLGRARLDVCFRELSLVGNGTLRPDVNAANERAAQDFLDLNALNEGAQEHQVLQDLFGSTNAISTVRLLQLSQLQGLLSLPGILRLTATNYAAYGETNYGGKKLKEFDAALWQTVQSVLTTPGISNAALVLMTPGEINSAVGKRLGALILSPRYHAALISPGLNGAESDDAAMLIGQEVGGTIYLLGNDYQYHPIEYFGHDLFEGDKYVLQAERTDTAELLDVILIDGQFISVFGASPSAEEQRLELLEYDANSRLDVELQFGFPPNTPAAEINETLENVGWLPRSSLGGFGNLVSDPVSALSGEFYVSDTDLTLPGPLPLAITRNYSSRSFGQGDFGQNWKFNLTPYLVRIPDEGAIDGAEPDGTVLRYTKISANSWKPFWQDNTHYDNSSGPPGPARNLINRIIQRTNSPTVTNFVVRPGDGSARVYTWRGFPKNGRSYLRPWLTSWVDSRGNALRFEYGEDPLSFDYAKVRRISSTSGAAAVLRYNERGLISELISKDGSRVNYSYNRWGDLIEVIRPDGSRIAYSYLFEPGKNTAAVSTNSLEAWVPFTNGLGRVDYQRGIIGSIKLTNLVSTHRILREEKPDGRVLQNEYDSKGRVVKQFANVGLDQRPVQNAAFTYQNDDTGNLGGPAGLLNGSTLVVDGLGNTNAYHYTKSKVRTVVDGQGIEERTGWFYDWQYFTNWVEGWEGDWYSVNSSESYPRSKASTTDRRLLVTSYKYDSKGNTTNIIVKGDLLGDGDTNTTASTVISFTSNNLPARVILPSGATNLYFYTNQWLLSREEIWPLGGASADSITNLYAYTTVSNAINGFISHGLMTLQVRAAGSPDAAITRYEYDERGYLIRLIRETGTGDADVVVTNLYSARGWLEEQRDAIGRRTRFAYDPMGRVQQREMFEAGAAKPISWDFIHYNDNGDVVWTDGPRFGPEDYTWRDHDGGGRRTQEIRWRSRAKSDGTGVEAETAANEFSMAFADFDVFGNQTRTIDARGNITSNRFDRIGRLIQQERYANGGAFLTREKFDYEPGGQMVAHTNALDGYTLMRYNARGQPVSVRNPDGSTNGWRYYADGRLQREYAQNGSYWTNNYDDKNRQITRVFRDAANVALATNVIWLDRRGNTVRFQDEGKHSFTNTYDGLDRLKATFGPVIDYSPPPGVPVFAGMTTNRVQQAVTNFYDAAGAVFISRNALGEKVVSYRDAVGRTTRAEVRDTNYVLIKETSIAYSEDHHSATTTDGSGPSALVSTIYTDNDGQPVLSVVNPATGVREFHRSSYDTAGNLVAATHQSSSNGPAVIWTTALFAYDGLNRLQSQTERDGALTTFAYNAAGNLTTRVLPSGQQWRASYNSAGQRISDYLFSSSSGGAQTNTYTYHSGSSPLAGLPQTRTDGRGVACTYTYDAWLRVVTNTHSGPLPEHNLSTVRAYDARGLATKISESFATSTTGPATEIRRSFDPYGLLAKEYFFVAGVPVASADQSWDSAGRRSGLGFGEFGFNYTWKANGAMASSVGRTGGGTYSYDTAGQLQSRVVGARTTTVTNRDAAGRVLARTTTFFGLSPSTRLTETLNWTGDGLLATHTQARYDFTDNRSYTYASQSRRLIEERLSLDASKGWTNYFTFDGGGSAGPGVLTRAGAQQTNSSTWSGSVDGFSRVSTEASWMLRQPAYGHINAYIPGATITVNVDGRPQSVTVIATGNSNLPTQWRSLLDLSAGAHQLSANARHAFSAFNVTSNRWFTNTAAQITRSNVFDGAGQITQRIWRNPNNTTNRIHTLTWDALGRLVKVVERDSTQSGLNWSALYDAMGRRLSTTTLVVTNGGTNFSSPTTLTSLFDPEVEFLEVGVSVNGAWPTWKLFGPDANGQYGALNGQGGFDAIVPGPELFCPVLSDVRGDVLAVYDQDHYSLHWNAARPTAYGGAPGYRPLPLGHGADVVQASAHGGIWSDSTGYYWRGARYYDGESGQWLSFDPYGFAASPNPYGYPPDPINFTDPDGRLARETVRQAVAVTGWAADTVVNTFLNAGAGLNWLAGVAADLTQPVIGINPQPFYNSMEQWQGPMSPFARHNLYDPNAPATQVATAGTILIAPGSSAGRFRTVARSEFITVRTYTGAVGREGITSSGTLRADTWVTLPGEIPSRAGHLQIETLLEIQPGRGAHFLEFQVPFSNLRVPANGQRTSGGALQFQLKEPVPIDPSTFRRPPGRPGG